MGKRCLLRVCVLWGGGGGGERESRQGQSLWSAPQQSCPRRSAGRNSQKVRVLAF